MQQANAGGLTAKDIAYIRMLELHYKQFEALLYDIANQPVGADMTARELSIAQTRLDETLFHTREFLLRQAAKRAVLPN